MARRIIIFSGKQYSGKDTVAKIMLSQMLSFKRCAMGDIIKLTYAKEKNITYEEIDTEIIPWINEFIMDANPYHLLKKKTIAIG